MVSENPEEHPSGVKAPSTTAVMYGLKRVPFTLILTQCL
jgi:hypothetical protein